MRRMIAVALLTFTGAGAAAQRPPAASAARADAIKAIDESAASVAELAGIQAKLMRSNAEMSKMYAALNKKIGEVGKLAAERGTSQQQLMQAIQQMMETSQSFNLQYLELQQNMQNESRQFTMVSNIMKTKHDTAKNSINNIR